MTETKKKPEKFDGSCSVCGKPGNIQQIPGVPVSSCFCDKHAEGQPLKPLTLLFIVGIFIGMGILVYYILGASSI